MKLSENSVLMRLSFSRLGNVRKADLGLITSDADKSRLKLGKVLFVSSEFAAVSAFDIQLSLWMQRRAIPCNIGYRGVSVLPLALLDVVEKRFAEAMVERDALVDKFLAVYDQERELARQRLNGQFQESNYPSVDAARDSFAMRWAYVTFEVPSNLPDGLREREGAKLQEKFEQVESEVRVALRSGLSELLGHLTDRLKVGPDGKLKVFRDTAVGNLLEFLELFKARNITDDKELSELAAKAQSVVQGVKPDSLRSPGQFRENVRDNLTQVKASIDELITTAPRRKFNLDD